MLEFLSMYISKIEVWQLYWQTYITWALRCWWKSTQRQYLPILTTGFVSAGGEKTSLSGTSEEK